MKKQLSEVLDAYAVIMLSLMMLSTPMDSKTSEEKGTHKSVVGNMSVLCSFRIINHSEMLGDFVVFITSCFFLSCIFNS